MKNRSLASSLPLPQGAYRWLAIPLAALVLAAAAFWTQSVFSSDDGPFPGLQVKEKSDNFLNVDRRANGTVAIRWGVRHERDYSRMILERRELPNGKWTFVHKLTNSTGLDLRDVDLHIDRGPLDSTKEYEYRMLLGDAHNYYSGMSLVAYTDGDHTYGPLLDGSYQTTTVGGASIRGVTDFTVKAVSGNASRVESFMVEWEPVEFLDSGDSISQYSVKVLSPDNDLYTFTTDQSQLSVPVANLGNARIGHNDKWNFTLGASAGSLMLEDTEPADGDLIVKTKAAQLDAAAEEHGIRLNWAHPSFEVDGYRIFRTELPDGAQLVEVSNTGNGATTYLDRNVRAGTTYEYRVAAVAGSDVGRKSNASQATTAAAALTAPEPPTHLTATIDDDGDVNLSWQAGAGTVTGYKIYRRDAAAGSRLSVYVEDTGNTDTAYVDMAVESGQRYVYRVRALNSAGVSKSSNFVKVRLP